MLLAVALVLLAVPIVGVLRQYVAQHDEIERLAERVEALEAERRSLEREIARLRDPEELERLARECFGMVRPGEIGFVNPHGPPSDPRC